MKYTFEIMKEYEDAFRGISVYSVSEDKKLMVDYVALEELEDAQKEINEAYQRGLDDAWEAAKKIQCDEKLDWETLFHMFNRDSFTGIFRDFSASEAIAKLKAYEEKQKADDKIEVGDEVEVLNSGSKYLIAWFAGKSLCGFAHDGVTCHLQPSDVRKTGRHFDILSILEEMKHD